MTETTYNLLVLAFPVLVPLALAALTAILWRNIQAQRIVSIVGLGVIVGCSVLLTMAVLRYDILAVEFGSWAVPFGISFVADRFAVALVMITGILACFLVLQYLRTGAMSHRLAFWTIIFGLADFAWAYGIGVLSFETPIQVFAIGELHATNQFPIALIPFLLAPIAMGYMIMTLIKLGHGPKRGR